MLTRRFTTSTLKAVPTSFNASIASNSVPAVISSTSSLSTPFSPSSPSTPATNSTLLPTLARLIMKSGKLSRAQSHLDLALSTLALQTSSPPLPILERALQITSPSIRIVGRRKGTKSLPTPQPLTQDQRIRQSWKWIVEASEKRSGTEKIFGKRLAGEILAVLNGQSEAIKKREGRHAQGVVGRANVGK